MCIAGQQRLIALILLPGNVARVMIPNQDRPIFHWLEMTDGLSNTAAHHSDAGFRFPKGLAASVPRIPEHVPDRVVDRQLPTQLTAGFTVHQSGKTDLLSTEPQQHLPHASTLGHLREDQFNRLLDAAIWIHLNLAIGSPAIAGWQREL